MNKNLIVASVVLLAGVSAFAYAQTTEIKTVPGASASSADAAPAGVSPPASPPPASAPGSAPSPASAPAAPAAANEAAIAPAGAAAKAVMASRIAAAPQKCRMVSNGTINVNFNELTVDIGKVEATLEDKVKAIEALGPEAGTKKLIMQSMNYNANSRNNGNGCGESGDAGFQANGNANFKVEPSSAAPAFAALLVKKGYSASFNVNKYRQCGNFNNVNDGDEVDDGEE
jgi:hypothetical protein